VIDNYSKVVFVPGTPFLVAYTQYTLYIWNLLTMSVWWSYRLSILSLAVESLALSLTHIQKKARFAVLVRTSDTNAHLHATTAHMEKSVEQQQQIRTEFFDSGYAIIMFEAESS